MNVGTYQDILFVKVFEYIVWVHCNQRVTASNYSTVYDYFSILFLNFVAFHYYKAPHSYTFVMATVMYVSCCCLGCPVTKTIRNV